MNRCIVEGCTTPVSPGMRACTSCKLEFFSQQGGASGASHESNKEDVPQQKAETFLTQAASHMADRAATYDAPQGERSMHKTVTAFNALTGQELSETDGWLFMALLKMARANQGAFRLDNYEDLVAYTALLGEAAIKEA